MQANNTMPIHGCVPNQLQALHDECGALRAENERLRALLLLALAYMGDSEDWCFCARCHLRREIKAVLEAATNG